MDSCVICLKVTAEQTVSCVYIDSIEWMKYNIKHVIEKHLWWWHLQKSSSKKFSHICGHCWELLFSFHAFYLEVEQKHKHFDAEKWPLLKGANNNKCNNSQELHDQHNENNSACKIVIANDNERMELSPCFESIHGTNSGSRNYPKALNISVYESKLETSREYDEYLAQTDYQFFCHLCNIALMNFSELKSHYRQEHNVSGYAICCNRKFYNRGPLSDHLRVHEDPNYFKCTVCNRVLSHRASYENHIKLHKLLKRPSKPMLDCDKCGKSFSNKGSFEKHVLIHERSSNSWEIYTDNENFNSNVIQTIELPSETLVDATTAGSTTNSKQIIDTCDNYVINVAHDAVTEMFTRDVASEFVQCAENNEQLFHGDLINSGNYCTNDDGQIQVYGSSTNVDQNFYIHILENTEENIISPTVKSETVAFPELHEYLFHTTSNREEKPPINLKHQGRKIKKPIKVKKIRCKNSKIKTKKRSRESSDYEEIKFHDDYLLQAKYNVSCDICDSSFSTFNELKTHYRLEHKYIGYATCCSKKFFNRGQFADHLRVHENPNYFKCTFCSRVLAHRASFKNHLGCHQLADETGRKSFNCVKCKQTFKIKANLDKHILRHHPDEDRSFQCDECNKVFANEYAVMKHKTKMHPKQYKTNCDLCGKLFYNPSTLKYHTEREHKAGSTSKEIPCNMCCKKFANKRVLYRHIKTIHSEEIKQEHICAICSNISLNLNDHMQHMIQSHTNQRKHACHLCEKKFTKPFHLREHLSTHTGVPLNSCPHCPRKFKSRSNMHTHRKRMHPKEWQEARTKKLSAKKFNK